jgi:light-harvesting complex II chlorophyll a/b binding protein 6
MAVASSASVSLQQRTAAVFSSSFVKGTSCGGGLRLSSSPSVSFGVGNVCPRVTAMATKRVIKSSKPGRKLSWLPGVKGGGNFVDPEWLDGSYVSLSLSLSLSLDS